MSSLIQQPKPKVLPTDLFAPPVTHPALAEPAGGPPVPVLTSMAGQPMSVEQFGARLQSVHDAHMAATGHAPSPSVALSAALVTPPDQTSTLFQPPHQTAALAALALHPAQTNEQFLDSFRQAVANGDYTAFAHDNSDRIQQLQADPTLKNQTNAVVNQGAFLTQSGVKPAGETYATGHNVTAKEQGLAPQALVKEGWGMVGLGVSQVINSLVHAPGGIYTLFDTEVQALKYAGTHGGFTHPLRPNPYIAKEGQIESGFVKQTVQDFQHPSERPGFLFLDLLGFGSGAVGTAGRLGRAAEAAKAGEGITSAIRAFGAAPPLRRATLTHGGYSEEMPLSTNPLVATVQEHILGRREAAANKLLDGGPAPARSILLPEAAQEYLDSHFSFARKVGREADARQRTEHIASMSLAHELDAAAGAATTTSRVLGRIHATEKSGLTRGEQKAIQALSWDDPNPLEAERRFHQSMIEQGIGVKGAHERQLAELKLAQKALENPRAKFVKALDLTRDVIAEQQRMKIEELGLAPSTAEGRVVKAAQVLREEPVGPRPKIAPVNDTYLNQHGEAFPTDLLKSSNTEARNIHDESGNPVGSIVFDARPGRSRIYVESVYIDPGFRGVENLRRLLAPILADGRPIEAAFENPRLQALFNRVASERGVGDRALEPPPGEKIERSTAPAEPRPIINKPGEMIPAERVSKDSFYLPTQRRGKVKRQPSQARGKYATSAGPYGIPPGRDMPELTHEFTGQALRAGDIRIDATNLATESYARTVRAVTVKNQWNKLWQAAAPTKRTEWDIPIRDANVIPDKLREVVAKLDEGAFTDAEADLLPEDMADVIRALYPAERDLAPEEIEGVKWIDSRLVDLGAPHVSGWPAWFANAINAPFRFLALYARPAYALNALGNAAMLVFDQGFLNSIQNVARSMRLEETDGVKNAATIRALVGAGKSKSYVTGSAGKVSRGVAEFWNRWADRDERVASFMYYADRKGYKTPADRDALLNDKAHAADLNEVKRRANKALVEFDNLSPIEKNNLRHIIFVYPWVSRSAVWSLRAIMEHPAKVALLTKLGEQEIENDPLLSAAPAWFRRTGYFPVGWDHNGNPKTVNPTSINTFTTLGDFLNIGRGLATGDATSAAEDIVGPAPKFAIHATTGRDEFGNKYPGSQFWGAAKEILLGLPQLTHLKAKKAHAVTPFDVRQRASLETHLNSLAHQTVFGPGWLDGFGSLITGGLTPKSVNEASLKERGAAELPAPQRIARELHLLNYALTRQGAFLSREVPAELRQSVRDAANITLAFAAHHKATGSKPTLKMRAEMTLAYLTKTGAIPAAEAASLAKQLKGLVDDEIEITRNGLFNKYAHGKELHRWDSDVRALYSFTKATFNEKAARLHAQGLTQQRSYGVPQAKLYEYGRGFLDFQKTIRDAKARKAPASEIRLLIDEHSKPVNGLPSYAAIAWANQTSAEQAHALLANTDAGWSTMTAVEKQLLGKRVDPAVTEGWHAYATLTTHDALVKQGYHGTLDKDQRLAVVKQIDKYYDLKGSFTRDYLFSREPLSQRLPYLNVVQKSPHRSDWNDLLAQAGKLEAAVASKQTTQSAARDAWNVYADELVAHYETNDPAFYRELKPILTVNPRFLKELIH